VSDDGIKIRPTHPAVPAGFSDLTRFHGVDWKTVPDQPGVYIIYDTDLVLYVGMAGRDGSGSLRKRLNTIPQLLLQRADQVIQ
jgi:hypothetical protein